MIKMKNCWICGDIADSEEHKFKASDLKRTYGKKFEGVYFCEKEIKINSFKEKALKFPKVICNNCNVKKTRPHDNAYDSFIKYTDNNFNELLNSQQIDFKKVFGDDWKNMKLNLYRYFAKHAGCKIETSELEHKISTQELANFINGQNKAENFVLQFELKTFVKNLYDYNNKNYKYTHLFNGPTMYFGKDEKNLNFGGWLSKNWLTTNWVLGSQVNIDKQIDFDKQYEKLVLKGIDSYKKSFNDCKSVDDMITYIEYGELDTFEKRIKHFIKIIK